MTQEDKELKERRAHHVEVLRDMRNTLLDSDRWEDYTELMDALLAGGMALQRLNEIDFKEGTK